MLGPRYALSGTGLGAIYALCGSEVGYAYQDDEGDVKTVYSVDNGNEWRPLQPPNDRSHSCRYREEAVRPGW